MEYKLNKIDTNLRQKINDLTSEGKVHSKDKIQINKDKKQGNKEKFQLKKDNSQKSTITIDAIKSDDTKNIEVSASNDDNKVYKGRFLDVRK